MASPSILPRPWATDFQRGGRSTSAATPHTNRRCRRDSVTTFPVGPERAGEGNATATPLATTPCRATAMTCTADSVRPRAARPVAGAGCVTGADRACCPPFPCGRQSPGWKPGVWGVEEGQGWEPYARGGGGHMPPPPPPPGPPRRPPSPPPHTPSFWPGEWIPQGEGVQQSQSAPATGLAALGISDSALHVFAAALQGLVATGVSATLPSPAPSVPTGKVATLSLLHLRFACGVAVDVYLLPVW